MTQGQILAKLDDSDYQVSHDVDKGRARRDAGADSRSGSAARKCGARIEAHSDLGGRREFRLRKRLDTAQTLVNRLKAQIASAKVQVQAADAKIGIDQQNIDNCAVRSPYDGIVVSKDAQPGEMVSPISAGGGFTRTGIATIVDMESNEIEVDVNENYIARVKPGQRVSGDAGRVSRIGKFQRTCGR